jgi:hypothetical protein
MKLSFHVAVSLVAFMAVCMPTGSMADDTGPQVLPVQNTPAVVQDTRNAGEDEVTDGVPVLYLPETSFHFENVPAGQSVTHEFRVQNKGTALLRITRVKTG